MPYQRMRDEFYLAIGCRSLPWDGGNPKFVTGFCAGQMEKVMSGVCRFSMFRPSEDKHERKTAVLIREIADIYGLVVHKLPDVPEYWCCKKENEGDFFDLLEMEPDSSDWHRQRGRMCGIVEIDERYHLRTGGVHD